MYVVECGEFIIKCIILPDRMYVVNKIYLHQSLIVSSFQAQNVRSGTMPNHFFKSTGIIKWQTFLKTALLFFKKQNFPSANELCSCAFHPAPSTSSPGYINTDSPSPTHFCTVSDSSTSATGRAGRMVSNRSADAVSFNFPHSLSSLYSSL